MKKALISSLVVCLAACFGCSKKQSSEDVESPVEQNDVNVEQSDENAGEVLTAPVQDPVPDLEITSLQWAEASNELGFNMLRKTTGNVVLSPYSAERAIGMVLDGANGVTADEIRTALCMPNANNLSKAGLEVEKNMVVVPDNNNDAQDENARFHAPEFPTVHIDNRIWVEKTYEMLTAYTDKIEAGYRAKPVALDFIHDFETARTTINDDVAKSTNDKITNLLPKGAIDTLTRIVLTNAVYFKGAWHENFNENSTDKAKFHAAGGDVDVDMMHHTKTHAVYQDDAVTVFEMAFVGDYSLYVILPNLAENADPASALENVEATLNAAELRKYMEGARVTTVKLSMPKFRIEYSDSLKKMLTQLGMEKAFSKQADLSGISGDRDLMVSDIIQKAYIDVNERGAEAAAATAVVMRTKAMIHRPEDPVEITVDHPFVYALVEKMNETALFVGRVSQF